MRILLVEDDQSLAEFIRQGFEEQGYTVDQAESDEVAGLYTRGKYMAAGDAYDAIILEVKPPGLTGIRTCRDLRSRGVQTPLMLVAPPSNTAQTVAGLNAGADDYLAYPFEFTELLARIHSVMRRGSGQMSTIFTCADLEIDLATRRVHRGGTAISLTPREFALLEYFMRNQERILTRTELAHHIWGSHISGDSNTIDVHISSVRRKIFEKSRSPLIHTLIGYGYMMSDSPDPDHPEV